MLDKYSIANYFECIKITLGGRFPFRSEITAKNRIVFKSNNIALLKALNGGRSFISRGMGALTKCNVDIPATLFNINRKGELNTWRLIMSNNLSLSNSLIQQFQGIQLIVNADPTHEFTMTTENVAKGYGISVNSIHNHKRRNGDELIENKHFLVHTKCVSEKNKGFETKQLLWTKRGVIRLGMFIKSGRAIKFRDWAENLIIEKLEPKSIKSKRPALPSQGSDFRKGTCDGIYYYEPMTQYGRIPIGILHGINTAAQTFVTEAVIKEALRRRIKMCEKKLASEFWLKLDKCGIKTHDTTGEKLYRLLEVDRELSIGNLETAMDDIFKKYWE